MGEERNWLLEALNLHGRAWQHVEDKKDVYVDLIQYCYNVFGFTFELKLSTRLKKYLGELATWDKTEAALREALNEFGKPWKLLFRHCCAFTIGLKRRA